MNIIAVGPREQDFEYTNGFFSGSITLYGSGTAGNISYCQWKRERINHNVFSREQGDFINRELLKKIEQDPEVRFMSYDPNQAYDCDPEIVSRTVCLNEKALMDKLNHKISFRKWAEVFCPVHHSDLLPGTDCTFESLAVRYGPHRAFVVQADFACGGEGTLLLTRQNADCVERSILPEEHYLVSPYIENNIPVNFHALIYDQDVLLLPPSIQVMGVHSNKLLYHGADFLEIRRVDHKPLHQFRESMLSLCRALQKEGYRGITGVDGILVGDKAYVMEMNNRFQGSTPLLNLALHESGLPSVQELNYESFHRERPSGVPDGFSVPYSCYTYVANENGRPEPGHDRSFDQEPNIVGVRDDGLCREWPIAPLASLERVIFRTNIVSVSGSGTVALHPNVPDMESSWADSIIRDRDILHTKIALINQGVCIPQATKDYLLTHGGMREGVYNAVDITLDSIVINSAVGVKFASLSPFSLEVQGEGLALFCGGQNIGPAKVKPADHLQEFPLSERAIMRDVCLLATDRVRVQHSQNCYFKRCGIGCRFCEVENHEFSFTEEDVFRGIDLYLDSDYRFRHFLIGGRSEAPNQEPEKILRIVHYIRSKGQWPIYVMCVPPRDLNVLKLWREGGVTELAMNLEIWDPALAKLWMPGKGAIPRERYLDALRYAAQIWGNTGAVRSAFIVGLEPKESLLSGVEAVCKNGAAPILSVFRPIPGTPGENVAPPDNDWLLSVYNDAVSICSKYGLSPGPTCVPCQNNTLSMPSLVQRGSNHECPKREK